MRERRGARDLAYVAIGVAMLTVCAWTSIPLTIPITLQTFAICLVAALLGTRLGLWTVAVYILLGAVGVPVFSGFRGGMGALLGTTGGYIIGFLFTALVVGLAVDRLGRKTPVLILSMVIGVLICYAFGTAWFVLVYTKSSGGIGIVTALSWCVFPYLIPDGVKIVLATILTGRLYPAINRRRAQ